MNPARTTNDPHVFAVCMAWDAFRLCIGMKPKNFTADEVVRWISLCAAAEEA